MTTPRVSVVILSHRPEFLPAAIASVTAQTYPNVELLVKHHRDYWGEKFNEAWQGASGKYLVFLPDDDTLEPGFCFGLVAAAELALADLAYSDHYVTGPLRLKWNLPEFDREVLRLFCVPFMTFMVRTEFWRQIGGWDGALAYSDWDAAIRMNNADARAIHLKGRYLWNRSVHGDAGSALMSDAEHDAALRALRAKHPLGVK